MTSEWPGAEAVAGASGPVRSAPTPESPETDGRIDRAVGTDTEGEEMAAQLDALAALLEAIDWRAVPTVSVYEAAAITARVEEARATVEDTDDERDVST